jgi:hypothetical protein
VPLGVLINARISVVAGGAVLLAAFALFARSLSPSPKPVEAIATAMAYAVLLLAMAISVASVRLWHGTPRGSERPPSVVRAEPTWMKWASGPIAKSAVAANA